jgi:hypothetical protein
MDTLTLQHTAASGTVLLNTTKETAQRTRYGGRVFGGDGRAILTCAARGMSRTPVTARQTWDSSNATPKCYARRASQ